MSLVSTVRYVMPYGLVQQFFRSKAVIRRRLADRNAAYAAHLSSNLEMPRFNGRVGA
jgi:hypothetical protein